MKTSSRFFAASFSLALALALSSFTHHAAARTLVETDPAQEQQVNALQRGYRTGYSDGYQAGWGDSTARRARDYRNKEDYRRADRVYVESYGPFEDYRDGYQQGFENGYAAGYDRRGFDSTIPATLARRGANNDRTTGSNTNDRISSSTTSDRASTNDRTDNEPPPGTVSDSESRRVGGVGSSRPGDILMKVELLNRLSSDVSQRGDPFEARVLEPREYEGAIVSGRVVRVKRAGRAKGTSELQLNFYQIRMPDGRYEDFNAQVVEVLTTGGESGVGDVDAEGGVRGESSTRGDVTKIGASAGIGAIIGAIAGGGKGAAIGAAIGGAAGTGGVLAQRGKDIRLERGQQMMIRGTR